MTALAWVVGLSGLSAAIVADMGDPHVIRGTAARRLGWFAVVVGTEMAGWWIGVHNRHVVAALTCAVLVALIPVVGDPDKRPEEIDTTALVVGIITALTVGIGVTDHNVIPVCSWWHARYEAHLQHPDADTYWDLCAVLHKGGAQ